MKSVAWGHAGASLAPIHTIPATVEHEYTSWPLANLPGVQRSMLTGIVPWAGLWGHRPRTCDTCDTKYCSPAGTSVNREYVPCPSFAPQSVLIKTIGFSITIEPRYTYMMIHLLASVAFLRSSTIIFLRSSASTFFIELICDVFSRPSRSSSLTLSSYSRI